MKIVYRIIKHSVYTEGVLF